MVFYYKHISIRWCTPFRFPPADCNAINLVYECAFCVAITKTDVGVWLQFGVRESFSFENISQVWFATILGIGSCQPSNVAKFFFFADIVADTNTA